MQKLTRFVSAFLMFILLSLLVSCTNNTSYSINFDSNGGPIVETIRFEGNTNIELPYSLAKDDYIFVGWFIDDNTFLIEATSDYFINNPIQSDLTLYAKWQIDETTLTYRLVSIYNLALSSSSFSGTYEEWLESVKGPQGIPGEDGKEVSFQVSGGYIQWQYAGDTSWINLVELTSLVGATGQDGVDGINGKEVTFRVSDSFIQWQYQGDLSWSNLVSLSTLIGEAGADGTNGTDGKEISFQVSSGYIQWQYAGDESWINLVELTSLVGPAGQDGVDGTIGKEVTFRVSEGFIQWQYQGDLSWSNLVSLSTLTGTAGANGQDGTAGKEVTFKVSAGYIQWQYVGDSVWTNLVELISLVGPAGHDGIDGSNGKEVTFRVSEGFIQWQYLGESVWNNLIALSTLTGEVGSDGTNGTDGKEVSFQVSGGYIQWQYAGDLSWINLVELTSLVGPAGQDGVKGKEVTFRVSESFIQWQFHGDLSWNNLVSLSTLSGKSSYELYKLNFPEYIGTEQEWLDDLVNGRLGTIQKWSVTFEYNDEFTQNSVFEIDNLSKIAKPIDPIRDGYTFDGWYVENEKWSFVGYVVTGNMILQAKWTEDYKTITYVLNNGQNDIIDTQYTFNPLITPTRLGYTFSGWFLDSNLTINYSHTAIPDTNITLYAKWTINHFTISFIDNESVIETIDTYYGMDLSNIAFPEPQHSEGYIFSRWSINLPESMPNNNLELVAIYEFFLDYQVINNQVVINGVTNINIENIVIPSTINNKPVAIISKYAFYGLNNVKNIVIPNSVIAIEANSFYGTSSLESITLPFLGNTRTATGSNAYFGSIFGQSSYEGSYNAGGYFLPTVLKEVIVTDATTIESYAFSGASSITNIVISNSALSIGEGAFSGASSLTSLTLPFVGNTRTAINTGARLGYVFGSITYTDSYSVLGNYYLPTSLREVIITDTQTIGRSAFYGASSLTNVVIPNSVTSIGDFAFYDASSLTNFVIPEGLTNIGLAVFDGASSLTNITIPNGVTSIGAQAFRRTISLTSIVIPESVTSIGHFAFYGASSLTSLTIPGSVTSIGSHVFIETDSLLEINVDSNNAVYSSVDGILFDKNQTTIIRYPNGISETSYVIPNTVTSIGEYAFYGANNLTSIVIPESVASIGDDPFEEIRGLIELNVNENNTYYSSVNGVLFDKNQTTIIKYPEGISETSYVIPSSVTSIGRSAFSQAFNLTSITIPYGVTSIGDYAFYEVNNLMNVVIPNSVTSIGDFAFYGANSLSSIVIPSNVLSIGVYAFYDTDSLMIYAAAISQPLEWASNWNPTNQVVVWGYVEIVDDGTMKYEINSNNTINIIGLSDSATMETTLVIPSIINGKEVVQIASGAFKDEQRLSSITIPSSVLSIQRETFAGTSNLATVIFEEGSQLTTIEEYAFFFATSLTNIVIPTGVTSIGRDAFSYVFSLTSIVIPASVISMSEMAFYSADLLTIYAVATSQPSGWDPNWNPDNRPVVWGYIG